jgi:hypothetical protein
VRRRRLLVAAVAGIAASLATAVGASAYWRAQANLSTGVITTGDLVVGASWAASDTFDPLYPGTSSDRILTVTSTGTAGTTLGWLLAVTSSGEPSYDTFQAWEGACDTGTPIPSTIVHPPGTVVSVCVRYSMSATAPTTAQGAAFTPTLTVTANQAHP